MGGSAKSGGDAAKSKDWFGWFGVGFSVLQWDGIQEILVDGKSAWKGNLTRSGATVDITLENFGEVTFYWGTSTQTRPAVFAAAGNDQAHDHPDYKDLAWLLWKGALLGRERKTMPNIEAIGYRKPVQTAITGSATDLSSDYQANLACVIAELLENDYVGLDLPAAMLYNFQAVADYMALDKDTWYVSPLWNQEVSMRTVVKELLEVFFYGFLRWKVDTGQLEFGYTDHSGSYVPPVLLTADDLDGPPGSWEAETWDDIPTDLNCSFIDKERAYKTSSEPIPNAHARQVRDDREKKTLTRKPITRRTTAKRWLREYLKMYGQPGGSGSRDYRREKVAGVQVGDLVRADIEPEPGGLQLQAVCRVIERTMNPVGPVTLKLEQDRSQEAVPYVPVADVPPNPQEIPDPALVDWDSTQLFILPPQLADGNPFAIGCLVSRTDPLMDAFAVHFNGQDEAEYMELGRSSGFALRGVLKTAYSDTDDGVIDVELKANQYNLEIFADDPGNLKAENDQLLMLICEVSLLDPGHKYFAHMALDGDLRHKMELFSIESGVLTDTLRYDITAKRARLGTTARSFAATVQHPFYELDDVKVWIFRRSDIVALTHAKIAEYAKAYQYSTFRIQTFNPWKVRPLANSFQTFFRFEFTDQFAPQFTWEGPDDAAGENYIEATVGQVLTFKAKVTDTDADLISVNLTSKKSDDEEVVQMSRTINRTKEFYVQQSFSFGSVGSYVVTLTAVDASGRTTRSIRLVEVDKAAGKVATPEPDTYGGFIPYDGIEIDVSCATADAVIEYQLTYHGQAPGASWDTYLAAGDIVVYPGDRLWLRATKSGLTASEEIYHDYYGDDYNSGW